jgi:hypothetical protein
VACAAGPDVSESGLVLALDGGNNKSHSSNRFISYGSGLITQDISFQVNGDGTFQRVAAGTVIGGYVVKTTDVVYSYALGSNGCHYHGNSAPIPAGSYATFSFDYLVTGATTYPITDYLANFENYGGGALGGSVATANSLQNVWQRRTFTSGPTASAGTQAMFLYPGSCGGRLADSGTIYFRNPKVEWTNVDTGDGNFSSMPNVTTWYDMSGNGNNGTLTNTPYFFIGNASTGSNGYISFDGTNDYISTPITGTYTQISFDFWGFFDDPTLNMLSREESVFGDWTSSRVHFGTRWTGSSAGMHFNVNGIWQTTPPTNLRYGWNRYSLIYDTVSNQKLIYLNGILSSSNVTNGSMVLGDFRVGVATSLDRYYRGNISNFSIYNRALTAQEIQQNYNATRGRYGI